MSYNGIYMVYNGIRMGFIYEFYNGIRMGFCPTGEGFASARRLATGKVSNGDHYHPAMTNAHQATQGKTLTALLWSAPTASPRGIAGDGPKSID